MISEKARNNIDRVKDSFNNRLVSCALVLLSSVLWHANKPFGRLFHALPRLFSPRLSHQNVHISLYYHVLFVLWTSDRCGCDREPP